MKTKLEYKRPCMQVVKLKEMPQLLQTSGTGTSGTGTSGDPNYTPFDKEEEW